MKGLEGLTIDEKYEIEEYRDIMKAFAAAATDGILEQVNSFMLVRVIISQFHLLKSYLESLVPWKHFKSINA